MSRSRGTGRVRGVLAAAMTAVVWLAATGACARPGAGVAQRPACQQPGEAVMPDSAGSLDETSSGVYCLAVGQSIQAFLHAVSTGNRWSPIASSDPSILKPLRTGVLTPPVGVTPGYFGGLRAGTATLSSSDTAQHAWSVTIVVS
jgi:hypothetical protein